MASDGDGPGSGCNGSLGVKGTLGIETGVVVDVALLDLAGVAGGPELLVAVEADLLHVLPRRLVEVAGVEVGRIGCSGLTHSGGEGQTVVGVDVDLADTVADAFLDFLDGNAVGLGDLTAVLVDHLQPFLRNGGGTMHHQVGVGDGFVDFGNPADRQHFTRGFAGELVGAVAGADGDRQGINLGLGDEVSSFGRVCQQLVLGEFTLETVTVFSLTFAGLQGVGTTSSPSTLTPMAWATSTTSFVTATL